MPATPTSFASSSTAPQAAESASPLTAACVPPSATSWELTGFLDLAAGRT